MAYEGNTAQPHRSNLYNLLLILAKHTLSDYWHKINLLSHLTVELLVCMFVDKRKKRFFFFIRRVTSKCKHASVAFCAKHGYATFFVNK